MTITEVKQALGSWDLRLRPETPREILDALTYFGHVVVFPGKIDPAQYGDNLLAAARYVGVLRNRNATNQYMLGGSGMAFWLGDEDEKGDVFETRVTITAQTFAASINALLPPSGSITAGTITAIAGTYSGVHQYQTPRKAITYVTDVFGGEWRVNGNGTLDAGTIANLYVTTPRAIIMRRNPGRDLKRVGMPGSMELATNLSEYTTRVLLLAEGEGGAISTGAAQVGSVPYNHIHGAPMKSVRVVSESETGALNANTRAQLVLNLFSSSRKTISLSTNAYDVKGDFAVGDAIDVWDPDSGFIDPAREVYWEGEQVNPVALRCVELTWPVPDGWTVAFRTTAGAWLDLSPYYAGESGETTIVVGELSSSVIDVGSQPVDSRNPVADSSVPAAPAFTGFSTGVYQSGNNDTRAAIRAQWSTPLNLDASTIVDGDHYEIRYRVNTVIGYQVAWDTLDAGYTWDALNTWDAPISSPIQASPEWQTAFIAWGTNAFTLTELTPGVIYEIQIRGVDAAKPPNQGPWSASSNVTTTGDIIAPSTPANPTVASSRIAIQVKHALGKSTGGTYNLELDLHHLDVHVGGSNSFNADATNKVGELIANAGMIRGQIAAVGTFQVEQVDSVWIKVVAVDDHGNKSGASAGIQATAQLIDDAHISDLTVSKVTAGIINATWLNAGRITTAENGERVEVNGDGVQLFDAAGYRTVGLDGSDGALSFWQPPYLFPPLVAGKLADGAYGAMVQDLFGNAKTRFGQLDPDGDPSDSENYGLAAVNAVGEMVKLSALAFGLTADYQSGGISVSSTSYVTGSGGPSVDVVIGSSRRCLVIVTCSMLVTALGGFSAIDCKMSFNITGPGGTNITIGDNAAVAYGGADDMRASAVSMIGDTGIISLIEPGTYTFSARYRVNAGTCSFSDRSIIVLPY